MRIAFVLLTAYLKPEQQVARGGIGTGGSEISSFYIARELTKRGHEVTFISFDSDDEGEVREEIEGIFFRRFPMNRANIWSRDCIFWKRGMFNEFDIVHFYGPPLFKFSYLVKLLNDVRTVVTLNYYQGVCPSNNYVIKNGKICNKCGFGDLLRCSGSISKALKVKLYRSLSFFNDAYILLSNRTKNIFKILGFPEKKMYVVPNFIPRIAELDKIEHNGNTLIYVGRLYEIKGVDLLIKALPKVKEEIKNFKCYIVGGGPELENLKKLATSLDISEEVCFIGFVSHENLQAYYLKSDVFVFPVRWPEPFGRTLIEAMAYGLPIIASDIVDPDVVDGAAILFKNNDYNDLADKIIYLLNNKEARERLSKAGREHVKNFYPEKIFPGLEEIYEKLAKKKNR